MANRDFDKDRQICEAASKGPWDAYYGCCNNRVHGGPHYNIITAGRELRREDATFIAAAREGWPAALDRIRKLEKFIAEKPPMLVVQNGAVQLPKIKSLKRQLQVAAEMAIEDHGCPIEIVESKPEFCVAKNGFEHCKQDEAECWKKYWRQKAGEGAK